jgi:hypothetical protein
VATKQTPSKSTKSPAKKVAAAKRDANLCHWGGGSYLSPKSAAKCTNKRDGNRQLCADHELAYRAAAKARKPAVAKAAKPKAEPKKLSAKARRDEYAAIVARLEAKGATTSDAQGAADVEVHDRGMCDPKTCSLHRISGRTSSKPPISDGL